jgi:hypothetical protein
MKIVEPVEACERVLGIEKLFRIAALAVGHLLVVLQQLLYDWSFYNSCSATVDTTAVNRPLLVANSLFDIVQSSEKFADKTMRFYFYRVENHPNYNQKDFIYPETVKQRNNTIDI